MARHFTKEEIDDIRTQLAATATHDMELPAVTEIKETDWMPFLQDGKNKRILINDFREILPEGGPRGYSAYEIAVQHGYEGTEEEWVYDLEPPSGCWMLEGGNEATGNQTVNGRITASSYYPMNSGTTLGSPTNTFGNFFTVGQYYSKTSGGWMCKVCPALIPEIDPDTEQIIPKIGALGIKIPVVGEFAQYEIKLSCFGSTAMTTHVVLSLSWDATGSLRTSWCSMCDSSENVNIGVYSKVEEDDSIGYYIMFGNTSSEWDFVYPNIDCMIGVTNVNDLIYLASRFSTNVYSDLAGFTLEYPTSEPQ